ncbi:MAG: hypothetical protein ABIA74_01970, partial [bacterium]
IFAIVFVLFGVIATAKDGGNWITRDAQYIIRYIPINQENIERFTGEGGREGIFGMTVGEENTGIQFFGTKYNALIIFPILALLIVLYKFFIFPIINYVFNLKEKKEWGNPEYFAFIPFYWVAITLFMAWSKLKFTYVFGLGVAIGAGLVGYYIFEFMKSRTGFEKKVVGLFLGFMLLVGIASGTFFMTQNAPNIEYTYGWKPALNWLKENTPEDAKMFNWWDEGHWITFMGERAVIEDNRNFDLNADIDTAKFILSTDQETAYKLVEKYGSDYLIFGSDLLEKQNSMVVYAYLEEPEKKNAEIGRFFAVAMPCSTTTDKLTGITTHNCGGNILSPEQINALPTKYITQPNQLYNERLPIFIYREKDNSIIYMFNDAANETMITRIWFEDPTITKFPIVYENRGVKIFKVVKGNEPEPAELANKIAEEECTEKATEIKKLIEEQNYCENDLDCVIDIETSCPFGCYNLFNKNAGLTEIKEKINNYDTQCEKCVYDCMEPPTQEQLSCVESKCVVG